MVLNLPLKKLRRTSGYIPQPESDEYSKCLHILEANPFVFEDEFFLDEIPVFVQLDEMIKQRMRHIASSILLKPRIEHALNQLGKIQAELFSREGMDSSAVDILIEFLKEALRIVKEDQELSDHQKKNRLVKGINSRLGIMLHDDKDNKTGFQSNVQNVLQIAHDLYSRLCPRERGTINPLRLKKFAMYLGTMTTTRKTACIDGRIDEIASYVYKSDYILDPNQPFLMNITRIIHRVAKQKEMELYTFMTELWNESTFTPFYIMALQNPKVRKELLDNGVVDADQLQAIEERFEDGIYPSDEAWSILHNIFQFLMENYIINWESRDGKTILLLSPLKQQQQQQQQQEDF